MPTGYTVAIDQENINFEQFASLCAHAFGAMVDYREETAKKVLPDEIKPSSYHADKISELTKKMLDLQVTSRANLKKTIKKEHDEFVSRMKKCIENEKMIAKRYSDMKKKVEAWTPPTSEHEALKTFMLNQLETGKPTTIKYYKAGLCKKMKTVERYLEDEMRDIRTNIKYHAHAQKEEIARCEERTGWIIRLKQSIKAKKVKK